MRRLGLNEIREEYLEFFESKGHLRLKSYSLIPNNDKSLLLINAGMAPLKDYFTGVKKMSKNRATSSQKCIRTADIDNVGKTQSVKCRLINMCCKRLCDRANFRLIRLIAQHLDAAVQKPRCLNIMPIGMQI